MKAALFRLTAVMVKEIRQLRRDRLTFGMVLGMPLMQMLLFGYAINMDVRDLKTAVANQSGSMLSQRFIADVRQTQVADIIITTDSPQSLEALLRRGEISVGIHIPSDFDRRLTDPHRPAAHLLIDGTDPTITSVANQLSALVPDAPSGLTDTRHIEVRPYFNPEQRSAVNIVPGLLGTILTMTMMLFTAVAIVRERERGNLELLINTPVSTPELMVGKVVPYILIGLAQVALIVALGQVLFKVPFAGTIGNLYLGAVVFITANLALGLLISTVARTQFQAMQMTFFIMLPSILLSGFMFPFEGMPAFAQFLGECLPNTHFIRIARGVMLRGADLGDLAGELRSLGLIALVALGLAMARFSRRLD
ncbi:MAG: ABC transporter permease [Pseudomonadota bacterium]